MTESFAGASAAPLSMRASAVIASAVIRAARQLFTDLERGRAIDATALRGAMEAAFGASDASGAWNWKTAYDACEAATVLFLRRYGAAMRAKAAPPGAMLPLLMRIASLLPTHTRRSEESEALQQFSTPIGLAFVASVAAAITPADVVLEPSAGTGLLAILAELAGASLVLNEFADRRAGILRQLFPAVSTTQFDAAHVNDQLDAGIVPSVVLMNAPFSAAVHVDRKMADAALRHVASALARLGEGGRLVVITGANFAPDNPAWTESFKRLQEHGRVIFSAAIDGAIYAKHGTNIDTRLTVIDRVPADDITSFPPSHGIASDLATLLAWLLQHVPSRRPLAGKPAAVVPVIASARTGRAYSGQRLPATAPAIDPVATEVTYEPVDWTPTDASQISDALYEAYALQSICIPGAQPHPTQLVQSMAMASVAPPKPSYRPRLPAHIIADGVLSDAQLESIIYAGEAHSEFLDGSWTVDATFDVVAAARDDAENGIQFRRGWFLGDGTGAGKGRQVAGILIDNWLNGRRRAVWISKSDKLIEDAQRDWSALGMERLLVTPLSCYRQGTPIRLAPGVLFTTYATLRTDERGEKLSRVQQIVEWLGSDFDGVIVFDESHAMQNAVGGKGERGDQAASQQGRAGLRLQHALPNARVVYVSATGATTVQNLAYAQRLGLWGGEDFPFATRAEFIEAIEEGGVAGMEVLARDLKALGLYAARSLSYEGVEYELIEHQLTPEQVRIYDAYAGAFGIIHNNLDAAMRAANIIGATGTLNAQAKSATRSAFESAKQRFFGHLLTSMKTPSLIRSIERDLDVGHAAVIQIVSTGEALMERRLAEIPTEEWGDVQVDITPREYVVDYLAHSFPVQLYEPFTDSEGNLCSRPVYRDGQPVESRNAVARRDRLIEKLASLSPVPGALDQIVQQFGTDMVAEVTGRSRRVIRKGSRLYLLEPGWKADAAMQGLGRTNRTNQAQPPLFRPIATDVKAEKRFLSTIARRLDTLGAITRGQRQTGGQGLFRPEDNLESQYGRDALRQLYTLLARGKVEGCSLEAFEDATGLKLVDSNGLKDELPPITTFLNRLLALTIELQNILFTAFEQLLAARIERAIASGTYDIGMETLRSESFVVTDRRAIYVHPATGAETRLLTITQRERNRPVGLDDALGRLSDRRAVLLINERSSRTAVQIPAPSFMLDDGEIEQRVRLIRPMEQHSVPLKMMGESHWCEADRERFSAAWLAELADIPEFSESTIHVVAGLLLPIWKRLPNESTRVYRLQTDTGERIIGRKVSATWVANVLCSGPPELAADAAFTALTEGRTVLQLAEGLQLRRVRVMGTYRIELSGFTDAMRDRLRVYGLFAEIISWKLRMFVPTDASGAEILAKVLDRYPIERIAEREAA
jgi:predicted RNA methylase